MPSAENCKLSGEVVNDAGSSVCPSSSGLGQAVMLMVKSFSASESWIVKAYG
jgi:hypothetical protein